MYMYMETGLWLLLELSTWDPIISRDQLSLSLRSNNAEGWYWYHCYQCMTIRYHRGINPASIAQSSKFEFTCPWSSEFCWKHDFASLVFSLFLNGSNSSRKEFALSVNNFFSVKKTPKGIMDFFLIMKKVRVASLAWETPTGPFLQPYQMWKQSTEE